MSTDRRRRAPTSRICTWLLPALLAGIFAAAGCHDLELSQLRCSLARTLSVGLRLRRDDSAAASRTTAASRGLRAARSRGAVRRGRRMHQPGPAPTGSAVTPRAATRVAPATCPTTSAPASRSRAAKRARARCLRDSNRRRAAAPTGLRRRRASAQLYDDTTVCGEAMLRQGQQHVRPRGPLRRARRVRRGGRARCRAPLHLSAPTARPAPIVRLHLASALPPNVCGDGSCGPIGNGLPCHDASQCQSGFCVDGVVLQRAVRRAMHGLRICGVRSERARGARPAIRMAGAPRAPAPGRLRRTVHRRASGDGLHLSGRQRRSAAARAVRTRASSALQTAPPAVTARALRRRGHQRLRRSTCAARAASARRRCVGRLRLRRRLHLPGRSCQPKGTRPRLHRHQPVRRGVDLQGRRLLRERVRGRLPHLQRRRARPAIA